MSATTADGKPVEARPPHVVRSPRPRIMGCFPGCFCQCNAAMCACRETSRTITEPSATARAMGATVKVI